MMPGAYNITPITALPVEMSIIGRETYLFSENNSIALVIKNAPITNNTSPGNP